MDGRFSLRLREMLDHAECSAGVTDGLRDRLSDFLTPYAAGLAEPEQRSHAQDYIQGLFSKLDRKSGEAIAYLHDQDRQGLQKFLGQVPWDHRPLLTTLARQVGERIGAADGVIVFDPSSFPKKGTKSVGVQRQWCGRLGKVENCQVAVLMGYVSRAEHALVNERLYLPQEWIRDRKRCAAAGVPATTRFRTRHELALEMLDEQGKFLPHAWVTGDDEMGRPAEFRGELRDRGERYLLAVPSTTLIRDLETEPPAYSGRGRPPQRPFAQVQRWCTSLPASAWTRLDVRDGEKGPLVIEAVRRRVTARLGQNVGPEEWLVVMRELQSDGSFKHDYYLGWADGAEIPLAEAARVAKAEHRIEECIRRGKSDAGLGDYQVRNWVGWHHHLTLSLIAAWFLVGETRRGKNPHAGIDAATGPRPDRLPAGRLPELQPPDPRPTPNDAVATSFGTGSLLSLSKA